MEWETVMGLEVHVELSTKTKIFCGCTTAFGGAPNTHCCPVCSGMPGTLPVLNRKVLEYAVRAGLALNCDISRNNRFDRKNYFYPDLPKAYQISQLYMPFAQNGKVELTTESGKTAVIRIHEIHMEEDAGKLVHSSFDDETYLDYNRCGVPLIEIVSEPDFRTAEEVTAYLNKLRMIFAYLRISDGKMEEGSMRADVNLSVRPKGSETFGTRTEMKNINSLKAIERAIAYETKRQIQVIESGDRVIQETRRWDDEKGKTFAMRSKENAQDYRYFPEPDIPPIEIPEEDILRYQAECPEFADQKARRYVESFGLSNGDAELIADSPALARLFEETVACGAEPAETRYWLIGEILYFLKEDGKQPEDITLSPRKFADFTAIIKAGTLNRKIGRDVFEKLYYAEGDFDIDGYIADNNLAQVGDRGLIDEVVRTVIAENPKAVGQYKDGNVKITGFFVGQAMKQLKNKADPAMINRAVTEALQKL